MSDDIEKSENKAPHVVERRKIAASRRENLFRQLFTFAPSNVKWQRNGLAFDFDAKCVEFVREIAKAALNDPGGTLKDFLKCNPWPEEISDLELDQSDRARFIVMNALKVWTSKEMNYMDTIFTGGQFRKKLRAMAVGRVCPKCEEMLTREETEFHHTVRDGRPPIPICSTCHRAIEKNAGNTPVVGTTEDNQCEQIKEIRRKTHASWSNLAKAVRAVQGLSHDGFGTQNVEKTSKSIIRRMTMETKLTLTELEEIIRHCS